MKRPTFLWQAAGFAFATLGGTLLHFLFDWTGGSLLVALFSAVNESTWEHMKLLYWPLLLFALIQRRFFKECKNFWCVKLAGILVGLVLIPVLFYTYNGVLGKSPDWVNILIFYVSAAAVFLLEWLLFKKEMGCTRPLLAFIAICLIGGLFVAFTFALPRIPLFQDPITGIFGIPQKEAAYFRQNI